MIEVGDLVQVVYNDNGDEQYVGDIAEVVEINEYRQSPYPYRLKDHTVDFSRQEVVLYRKAR